MTDENKPIYENPFSALYLAEQFVREAEDTVEKGLLSPEIFGVSEVSSLVMEQMNHFLIGVPGSGKTMALAFLRVECLSFINQNDEIKKEFQQVWRSIDPGLWGIYHGLLMNEELLSPKDFRGFGLDDSKWTEIFGDFTNAVCLRSTLRHLQPSADKRYIPEWLGTLGKDHEISKATESFAKELNMPQQYHTLQGLLNWTEERLRHYRRMIKERTKPSIDMSEIPNSYFFRDIGYLVIRFMETLRKYQVIGPKQQVFVILDEYDQCVAGGRPEFARSINSFIKTIARGPVSYFAVKVGSRPHGFHDKRILGGNARIEDGRDYNKIDLSILRENRNRKVFSDLIKDIANRRLKSVSWFGKRGMTDIKELLEDVTPIDEGDLYRRGKTNQDLHFRTLESYCKPLKDGQQIYSSLVADIKKLADETLYQEYLIIEACRRIQRLRNRNGKGFNKGYRELIRSLGRIAAFLNSGGTAKNDSKIYYKLKDMREPALFLLANSFRQQRYYCGFETMRLMCEGVPLAFIKLSKQIFNEVGYNTVKLERTRKIDIRWQNPAIRKVAGETRDRSRSDLCSGQSFLILLDELGFILRTMQLSPTAPYPSPNGFSVEREQGWLSDSGGEHCNTEANEPLRRLKRILLEATDWGYLIELAHRSKMGSLKTRTKYYINSILAPYYDLSVRHLKEPLYIKISDLVELSSTDGEKRSAKRKEVMLRIKSLRIAENRKDVQNKQITLFDSA